MGMIPFLVIKRFYQMVPFRFPARLDMGTDIQVLLWNAIEYYLGTQCFDSSRSDYFCNMILPLTSSVTLGKPSPLAWVLYL